MSNLNQVLSLQAEKVRGKLQDLLETSNNVSASIRKSMEAIPVSNRAARLPVVVSNPGDFGVVNLNGGPLGLGSGMDTKHMEIQYFSTKMGVEITTEAMWTTDAAEKAIKDAFKENLRRALIEAQIYDDIAFHNITGNQGMVARGDGATAIGGTNPFGAGQSATITLDSEFATQLLRINMPVEIYDTTLATQKTASNSPDALPRITAINHSSKSVTITGAATQSGTITLANTDKLLIAGIAAASVSFKNGLYAFNTTTTSGNLLNLSRTAVPELNSNTVNAASSAVSAAHIILLKHLVAMRRGKDAVNGLKGLAHPAQMAQIAAIGVSLSQWNRGASDKMIDIVPGIGDSQPFGGVEFELDVRQSRSRLDLIQPKVWTRVRLRDLDWFEVDGQRVFEKRSSNGGVATSVLMYLVASENFACVDPGSQGFIYGLAIPAGY